MADSFVFFLSTGFVVIKEQTNSLIIGSYLGFQEVTYYDYLRKIIELSKQPFLIIRDAIFPNIIQNNDLNKLKKIGLLLFILSILFYFILLYAIKDITILIGNDSLLEAVPLFNIMGLNINLTVLSVFLGIYLIVKNKQKYFMRSLIISTLIFITIVLLLVISKNVNIQNLIVTYTFSLFIETVFRYYYSKK
jgi:O-antigen/teichoic acid export membrane protein